MGEFLGWSIIGVIILFIIIMIALIDTKQDFLKHVLTFVFGFISCLLVVLMVFGGIYYFNLI